MVNIMNNMVVEIDKQTYKTTILSLASIGLIFILHALYLECTWEDAFITFRFSKNLANGHGFVWNIGEGPVEGYTNFLWVVLNAGAIIAGIDPTYFSLILGLAAGLLTIIYAYYYSAHIFNIPRPMVFLAPFLLAVSGPLAAWSASGMETSLFTCLAFVGSYYWVNYWNSDDNVRQISTSYFLFFLSNLVRPEGIIFFTIFSGFHLILCLLKRKKVIKHFIIPVLFFVVPFCIYFIWRYKYFGYLLPNTFYAKTGGSTAQYLRGLHYSGLFYIYFVVPFIPLLPLFFIWRLKKTDKNNPLFQIEKLDAKIIGTVLPVSIVLIYSIYISFVGGDYMALYRFYVPLTPFIYILLSFLVAGIYYNNTIKTKRLILSIFLVFGIISTIIQSTPLEWKLFPKPSIFLHHGGYSGVKAERWHSGQLTLIGKFFKKYQKSSNESIATHGIGAVGYYSDLKIYGQHGLVDPVIAHQENKHFGKVLAGHEKNGIYYNLTEKKPTYVVYYRHFGKFKAPSYHDRRANKYLLDNYEMVYKWLFDDDGNKKGLYTFMKRKS